MKIAFIFFKLVKAAVKKDCRGDAAGLPGGSTEALAIEDLFACLLIDKLPVYLGATADNGCTFVPL